MPSSFSMLALKVIEPSVAAVRASNQLRGTVVELETGPISSRVVIEIAPKVPIVSVITTASALRLGLQKGKSAVAIIKATEVILGVDK